MKSLLSTACALGLALLITGCADQVPTSALNETRANDPGAETPALTETAPSPQSVLSSGALGAAYGIGAKGPGPMSGNGFTTPLFGLATAPNGDLLVADAGVGVSTLSGTVEAPLPGVTDMSPIGRGGMWAIKGLTGDPGDDTGQGLYRVSRGQMRMVADLFDFEENHNPDGASLIDSNPFDVQSLGGGEALVADAGGNTLLRIDNRGQIEVVAVFPNELVSTGNVKDLAGCPGSGAPLCGLPPELPAQPVSTSIAIGPDGYYYVGELKGFPAPTGESNVWKISPQASGATCGSSPDCVKAFDGGFTSIIDLAFDQNGTLHVTELEENSWFALELDPPQLAGGTINACDLDTESCTEVASGIPILTAITFGTDGSLWATKNALIPSSAEVIQVTSGSGVGPTAAR